MSMITPRANQNLYVTVYFVYPKVDITLYFGAKNWQKDRLRSISIALCSSMLNRNCFLSLFFLFLDAFVQTCANMQVYTCVREGKILREIRRQVGEKVPSENLFLDYSNRAMRQNEEAFSQKRTNSSPSQHRNIARRSNFQPRNLRCKDRFFAFHGEGNREIQLCWYPISQYLYLLRIKLYKNPIRSSHLVKRKDFFLFNRKEFI